MKSKANMIFKYLLLSILGICLALLYSYIVRHNFSTGFRPLFAEDFSVEVVIVFFVLYWYLIAFMKFLIRLFK